MAKRKTQHESAIAPARRSGRSNAGRGGVSEQLQKLGTVLESPTKAVAKRGAVYVPDSEPLNAFAPKEKEAGASNTRKTSKKKVALRQLPPSSDEDQEAEPIISKPILHPAKSGDRFGFQTQGATATAPSYVGTQMTSKYQAMDRHATSQDADMQSPARKRSRSVTTAACPPASAAHEVERTHTRERSRSIVAAGAPTAGSRFVNKLPTPPLSRASSCTSGQARIQDPNRAPDQAPHRVPNHATSRVTDLASSRAASLIASRAPSLAPSRAPSLAHRAPSQRSSSLTVARPKQTGSNPEFQPRNRSSSVNRMTNVNTSRAGHLNTLSSKKSTLEARALYARKGDSLEKIAEVASPQRQSFAPTESQFEYVDDYEYDVTNSWLEVDNLRQEHASEEEPVSRTGSNTIDGADESMYQMDASVNIDRDQDAEERSENFDLNAVQSDDTGTDEEQRALTTAMITESTRRIRAHFHGRESTPKDITMSDVPMGDIDLSVDVADTLDLDHLLPAESHLSQEPPTRQAPARMPPPSSRQRAARNDDDQQETRQERSTRMQKQSRRVEAVNTDYNVLGRHHAKNRRPRVPSEVQLSRAQQLQTKDYGPDTARPDDAQYEVDSEPAVAKPRKRTTKAKCEDPTLVRFYPRNCAAMIDLAKFYFRCHQILSDPFPSMHEAVDGICRDVLDDAMGCFGKLGRKIEDGYWEQYKDSMAVCVWKDINTFRSEVRKVILDVVPIEYALSAPNLKTSAERLTAIKARATVLAHKFSFLQGPRDEQDRASNFSHNCIRVACQRIFYRKGTKTFRNDETFRETVPYMAVLYVASYIKGVLDSYAANGTMDGKVSPVKNEEDFWKMHSKMQAVLDHDYHGPKLTDTLKAWASEAYTSELLDVASDASSACEVDLN